ncbi:carcinoembryonic antigen-related cell adhesion molecule 21-like [Nerophis ophidion]|uniref:carcinoembryonic antigen-related cell adhesion molecule 21-like n=1 Tax=Nerophis ophidion TaxID=159077 RepID=UPI002ADFB168|nr:carcinoembryonic antigen-related cell adhesion molecule 21-like [Nerophis ophidion]
MLARLVMAGLPRKLQACLVVIAGILTCCCTGSTIFKKVGDEVVLRPNAAPEDVKSIVWYHGQNIAIEWDGQTTEVYRQFKNRTRLNHANGELTITGLMQIDSGSYSAEINFDSTAPTNLTVLSPVPEPTIQKSCDAEMTECTLTCAGNTAGAEPVIYTWKFGESVKTNLSKDYKVQKDSLGEGEISCQLQNPVSKNVSPSTPNPFHTGGEGMKLNAGLTVFICLLTAVVLLVLLHKCRTGMWFFRKESNPWEADFWRKTERQREDALESNGRTSHQEKAQTEEEEASMT